MRTLNGYCIYRYGWKGHPIAIGGRTSHLPCGGEGNLLPLVGRARHCQLVGILFVRNILRIA